MKNTETFAHDIAIDSYAKVDERSTFHYIATKLLMHLNTQRSRAKSQVKMALKNVYPKDFFVCSPFVVLFHFYFGSARQQIDPENLLVLLDDCRKYMFSNNAPFWLFLILFIRVRACEASGAPSYSPLVRCNWGKIVKIGASEASH